jgi:hypothetical protein
MGLDIYISKKTFIGAMFHASGIGGIISLTKRGKQIPIKLQRVAYVIEDVYHGNKTYWLHNWLNSELPEELGNAEEQEIDWGVMDRLHRTCIEILAHRDSPDLKEICREKLRCDLKPGIDKEALELFLDEVEELAAATDPSEKTDNAVFYVSASW